MDGHNFERLKEHILALSLSQDFGVARTEWDLEFVEISEEKDYCPCGQEIREHCYIRNRVTGHKTYVGNVCIRRFMQFETGTLFDGLKRIKADLTANANDAVIEYAWERGYLFTEREYCFLKQTRRKRKLSQKQSDWKQKINRRIVEGIAVRKRSRR